MGPLLFSYTGPYNVCTKIPFMASLNGVWCIAMRVILCRTPSVQGAVRIPRMCTLPVLDVQGPLPFSCPGPYCGSTKFSCQQSVHRRVLGYHEHHCESYT